MRACIDECQKNANYPGDPLHNAERVQEAVNELILARLLVYGHVKTTLRKDLTRYEWLILRCHPNYFFGEDVFLKTFKFLLPNKKSDWIQQEIEKRKEILNSHFLCLDEAQMLLEILQDRLF